MSFLALQIGLIPLYVLVQVTLHTLRQQRRQMRADLAEVRQQIYALSGELGLQTVPAIAAEDISKGDAIRVESTSLAGVLPMARVVRSSASKKPAPRRGETGREPGQGGFSIDGRIAKA